MMPRNMVRGGVPGSSAVAPSIASATGVANGVIRVSTPSITSRLSSSDMMAALSKSGVPQPYAFLSTRLGSSSTLGRSERSNE